MASQKLSLADAQRIALERGGECLSTSYVNNTARLRWKCSKGHEWECCLKSVKDRKTWCPHCAGKARLTIEVAHRAAEEKGGTCLSKGYKNLEAKLLWKCSREHTWEASLGNVKKGHWCPTCAGNASLSLGDAQALALFHGGMCLSTEYTNTDSSLIWRCCAGHQWEASLGSVKYAKSWCPNCMYKNEQECRQILEEALGRKFPKKRLPLLGRMELDGVCLEIGLGFEYHGEQHYGYVPHFHRNGEVDVQEQKARDIALEERCFDAWIVLLVVPCYVKNKREFILTFLKDNRFL